MLIKTLSPAQAASKQYILARITPISDPLLIQAEIDAIHLEPGHEPGPDCGSDDCIAIYGLLGPEIEGSDPSEVPTSATQTLAHAWDAIREQRKPLLELTDQIVLRCLKEGLPFPADWRTYWRALRDITDQPYPPTWPVQPPIPAGV